MQSSDIELQIANRHPCTAEIRTTKFLKGAFKLTHTVGKPNLVQAFQNISLQLIWDGHQGLFGERIPSTNSTMPCGKEHSLDVRQSIIDFITTHLKLFIFRVQAALSPSPFQNDSTLCVDLSIHFQNGNLAEGKFASLLHFYALCAAHQVVLKLNIPNVERQSNCLSEAFEIQVGELGKWHGCHWRMRRDK